MFSSPARFALKVWLGFVATAFVLIFLLALLFFIFGDAPKTWQSIQKYWSEILFFGGLMWAMAIALSLPSVLVIGIGIGLLPLHIVENPKERLLAFLGISAVNNLLYFALTFAYLFFNNRELNTELFAYTLCFYILTFLLGCLPIVWLNERTPDDYFTD
jgi:hypothetical protein